MKVGFIGYGSMGSMLVNKFIENGALMPQEIIISTRTKSKLDEVKGKWNEIGTAICNEEAARRAKYIFICVKPAEVKSVLTEIRSSLTYDSNIISVAGPVRIKSIEETTGSKVTKVTPTLASEVSAGITLICHGSSVGSEEADYIDSLFNRISIVKRTDENNFELSAELTSCMPGFIASIFQEIAASAKRFNKTLNDSDIDEMICETLYGTARLLKDRHMSFQDVVGRVATKGGITEEGVKIFESQLPTVFDEMFRATLEKRRIVNERIENIFAAPPENHDDP